MLPLARPGILSGCALAFARSMGEFGATIMVAGNIPGQTRTIPLEIYNLLESPGGAGEARTLVHCLRRDRGRRHDDRRNPGTPRAKTNRSPRMT